MSISEIFCHLWLSCHAIVVIVSSTLSLSSHDEYADETIDIVLCQIDGRVINLINIYLSRSPRLRNINHSTFLSRFASCRTYSLPSERYITSVSVCEWAFCRMMRHIRYVKNMFQPSTSGERFIRFQFFKSKKILRVEAKKSHEIEIDVERGFQIISNCQIQDKLIRHGAGSESREREWGNEKIARKKTHKLAE